MNNLQLKPNSLNSIGVTLHHVKVALEEQEIAMLSRYHSITFACSVVLSIAVAIATFVASLFLLIHSSTRIPLIINGVPQIRFGLQVLTLQNPGLFVLSFFSLSFGWFFAGIAAGGLPIVLGRWIITRKLEQLNKIKFGLVQKYENHGIIGQEAVKVLMANGCNVTRKNLVMEMNFEQLMAAKQILSANEFSEFIGPVLKDSHENWRFILSLAREVNPEKILALLQLDRIREIAKKNPFFVTAIQEQLKYHKDIRVSSLIVNYQLPSLMPKNEDLDKKFKNERSLKVDNNLPIVVDKDVLAEKSLYFNRLFNPVLSFNFVTMRSSVLAMKEHGENEIRMEEDFEKLKLFVNALQGRISILCDRSLLQLWEMAEKYSSKLMLNSLSIFMIQRVAKYTKQELVKFLENQFSLSPHLTEYIENMCLSKKLNLKNVNLYCRIAKLLESNFFNKCYAYAAAEFKKNLKQKKPDMIFATNFWKINQDCLDENAYIAMKEYYVSLFSARNIKSFYEIAEACKDDDFRMKCINYCKLKAKKLIRYVSWPLGEIPNEISAILYQKTREVDTY